MTKHILEAKNSKSKVLILAAGKGSRLYPLTIDKPKCLVNLFGKSLLQRQVDAITQCGIENLHIVTGYQYQKIKNLGFEISVNTKFYETNMVETLFSARNHIDETNDLIITYGDIIFEKKNLEALLRSNEEVSLMIDTNWRNLWNMRFDNPLDDAETLVLDENNYIIEIGKKPEDYKKIHGQYTGLIKIRSDKIPDLIKFYDNLDKNLLYDGQNYRNMYMTSFIQELINSNWKVKAILIDSGWLEIDSLSDINKYEELEKNGNLKQFFKI